MAQLNAHYPLNCGKIIAIYFCIRRVFIHVFLIMLSYQHAYHAGNLADLHKHQFLVKILSHMVAKDKAITYIETHAGRGLYDLQSTEAQKTGEAQAGILRANQTDLNTDYQAILQTIKQNHGVNAYPGSPMIGASILRSYDKIHLAELHPQEFTALQSTFNNDKRITMVREDGFDMALSICPPKTKRGLVLIDPSYEIKTEYYEIPKRITQLHKKWNTGVIMLWYPILPSMAHIEMVETLKKVDYPKATINEVMFESGLNNHRLKGSGLFVINTPPLL